MKKYVRPSLKGLGLLREVTKFSVPPVEKCWIAAVVFEEHFVTGPRVNLVRRWLHNEFEPSGLGAKLVMCLYQRFGQRVARVVEKSSILKRGFRKLFDKALAKAEAKYGTLD